MIESAVIIGGGLAGSALALALTQQGIPCEIYEARAPNAPEIASGVLLSPNGLSVLDKLGILARIKDICWKSEFGTIRNDRDEIVSKTVIANPERNGYYNHRIWRRTLLDEMRTMLTESNVRIHYNAKFEGVVGENEDGVTFKVGGEEKATPVLIGADGIYSSVRKYITNTVPEYTGTLGIIAHIKWNQVAWPDPNYEHAVTLQGKPGAFFMIPENADGSEIMVGMQVKHNDQGREGWEALNNNLESLKDFYRKGYDDWTSTGRSVIDAVCNSQECTRTLYAWPFLKMPVLERWASKKSGRVILVGDAAHALPPSSGQGVNMALEDVYALTTLLGKSQKGLRETLGYWQSIRQERINGVLDFTTNTTDVQRLSEAERRKLVSEGKFDEKKGGSKVDREWIYSNNIDERIWSWVSVN